MQVKYQIKSNIYYGFSAKIINYYNNELFILLILNTE